ncbi:hypothetical protein AVEN_206204-1 [Araneus ventricosus]|uniref:Uncharacterized protein n=1 Tax=Araneus ventricosus TaxID=182803 RepID=A0A4Y2L9Y7_ARAVE|nr:hypothetical protein AVEN_206204-1 [Araneus ventricosus]
MSPTRLNSWKSLPPQDKISLHPQYKSSLTFGSSNRHIFRKAVSSLGVSASTSSFQNCIGRSQKSTSCILSHRGLAPPPREPSASLIS